MALCQPRKQAMAHSGSLSWIERCSRRWHIILNRWTPSKRPIKSSAVSLLPNFRSSSGSSVRGSAPPSLPFFLPPCRCRSPFGVSDQSLVTQLWRMLEVANSQLSSFSALCRRRAGPRQEMTLSRHLKGSNTDFWRPFLR